MSGVVCAVLGYLIGIVSLRLKGHYFSIFTLCVGYIMFLVIEKWEGLTHGTVGIMGIPAPEALGALSFESPLALYYLVLAFLVASVWVMRRIVRSLLGRTFMAIRNSDELAEALGINLMRNKVLAFMLSVVYAGVAGGLYAGFVRFIGDREVRSEEQAREYIALRVLHSYALNGFGMYAIERLSDGAWLGNAGLVRRDGLPGPDFAGQGYAGEAARTVFAHARGALGLHDLYGITDLDNVVSGKILLGLGMQERGVIQLPGIETPSRLFATLGAAEV